MAWQKKFVWVLTAWFREQDEDGYPLNYSSPSEEFFAESYSDALRLKTELLEDGNYEDVWISDDMQIRELWTN